jgi:hypothetical protein
MANTFFKIASTTVGSGGASAITFSSIPGTYTDLKLLISARTSSTGPVDGITLSINGSASNFNTRYLFFNGFTGGAFNASSDTVGNGGWINGATSTASSFSNVELYFPNYTSTTKPKEFSVDSVEENNTTGTNTIYMGLFTTLWNPGTQAAITSLTLTPVVNYVQHTTATLYGIKNS